MPRQRPTVSEWGKVRAEVALVRVRLEATAVAAKRLADDIAAILAQPPFTATPDDREKQETSHG